MSLIELTPFLACEITKDDNHDLLWLCGGYPDGGVISRSSYPQWQRDYLALLTQRDLPNWGLPAGPQTTERLLRMLAAVHGQPWNASQIGQGLGLSYHTVNSYLDYLVGAFLIRRLPPYLPSIRKRLVKRPRVYWRDSGLLHALLGADESSLLAQPWVGASWEGFIIEQTIGLLGSVGIPYEAFTFRTSDQHELDLVLRVQRELWAVEIKLTASPKAADMERLDACADLIDASRRYLVSRVRDVSGNPRRASCNLSWLTRRILELPDADRG